MICSVFAYSATSYTKTQFEFWKDVYSVFENSLLFTEINNQNDENFRMGKLAEL